ncbi:MAG: hypothetical protein WDO73_25315 [Ignavibacteriota bacterium]
MHVDVTFTADIPQAERLAKEWRHVAPVKGVASPTAILGIEFIPGRYIKDGYTFTSRGCPRRCWFCSVWKRRPQATPILPFAPGWNILDDKSPGRVRSGTCARCSRCWLTKIVASNSQVVSKHCP